MKKKLVREWGLTEEEAEGHLQRVEEYERTVRSTIKRVPIKPNDPPAIDPDTVEIVFLGSLAFFTFAGALLDLIQRARRRRHMIKKEEAVEWLV